MFFAPVAYRNPSFRKFLNEVVAKSDEKTWTITADVPGIAKDQLEIGIEDNVVRVKTKEGASRQYGVAYELPLDIDASTSSATLENGVLTLTLGKKVPVSNVQQIAIQ